MKQLATTLILALSVSGAAYAEHIGHIPQHNVPPQPAHAPMPATVMHDDYQFRQNHKHFEQNSQYYISHQKAAEIALKAFEKKYHTKGYVEDVDFEHKIIGDYYEVEIEDERDRDYEVRLDAKTGKVISIKRDY